jgi:hypothetical protein
MSRRLTGWRGHGVVLMERISYVILALCKGHGDEARDYYSAREEMHLKEKRRS